MGSPKWRVSRSCYAAMRRAIGRTQRSDMPGERCDSTSRRLPIIGNGMSMGGPTPWMYDETVHPIHKSIFETILGVSHGCE